MAEKVVRILVVEDETIIALDLAATLEELGYQVVGIAASGDAAVNVALAQIPDLVLMDIRLAGAMDGVEAAARIRAANDIPVIFLTSHSDDETLRRATLTSPLGYLVKPFNPAELRCTIEVARHRHHLDVRLRDREQWLATTLRSISEGVIATDPNERVTFVNSVAETLTGWTHAEALGLKLDHILTLVDGVTATELENPVRIALQSGVATARNNDALVSRTGATILVADSAAPIVNEQGTMLGGVMVLRDVTAQRDANEEIRRLNSELERRVLERTQLLEAANAELEAFSYSVAHDLRSPLRGIDGYSQMLAEDHLKELGPEAAAHLQRIRLAAQRMGRLIDDLLRLARVSRLELAVERIDVSALAQTVIFELQQGLPERSVDVRIEPNIWISADRALMRIALENLLGNALKCTAKQSHATIEIGAQRECDSIVFFVRDNGAGFDMRYADRLFGAFQRLHNDSAFEGTGIGLAIVKRIINRHGGQIWAEGAEQRGATFYFAVGPHADP